MSKYTLAELIFRTNEITNARTRVCPNCLEENALDVTTCTECANTIVNYSETTFLPEFLKNITTEVKREIGLGAGLESEKLKKAKEQFNDQYDLWDQRIVQTAKFVNRFSMSPLNPLDHARNFLDQFPMSADRIEKIQLAKIDLELSTFNTSEIKAKLLNIEHKSALPVLGDFASWSHVYLQENIYPDLIRQNMRWLNVVYGYYLDLHGNEVPIDEKNPAHISDAITHIRKLDLQGFNLESMLFPLHWKILIEERLYPDAKPMISRARHKAVLGQWMPTSKAQAAWRDLGLLCCQKEAGSLSEEIKTYRALQVSMPFEERDLNFLFTLAVVTGDYSDGILHFPYQQDSYFAPLISLYGDESYVQDYFLNSSNRESWLRALHFYDFSQATFANDLAKKIFTDLSDDEFMDAFSSFHPSLNRHLFNEAVISKSQKRLKKLLSNYSTWKSELQNINLYDLFRTDNEAAKLLLEKSYDSHKWPSDQILSVLKELPSDTSFLETLLRALENDSNKKTELALRLFDLWLEAKQKEKPDTATKFFDRLLFFVGSKNPFSNEENQEIPELQNRLMELISSDTKELSKLAEEFIDSYVDPGSAQLNSLIPRYSHEEIFRIFSVLIKDSKYLVPKAIAYKFLSPLIQSNSISLESLQNLSKDLPFIDERYRDQLAYELREKLPKSAEGDRTDALNQTALLEINELKKKMAQMEQEKKNTEERDRIVNETRDKTTRYQIKMAELQSWYQIEMNKVMTGTLPPEEKSKKITEISEHYSNALNELAKILN